ncbi:2-phosphosulfolactate phosphatase [Vallitalea okinawensis]|uniref:2-phosphosulfolactate phosphatase n=1 Tax=Vallitalea okinawensis TaxID=2078660 RepID=UPI000CFCBB6F|nr:2-phosphosulfolactate phosphatase [Vallitalea okinawensis]
MEIKTLQLLDGAKQAKGLTVIIDVFRAFTVECFLFHQGVHRVYAVSSIEKALVMKKENPDVILIGERNGFLLDGFHYGNSPHYLNLATNLKAKTIVHTTSAGTQGIVHATLADEIITGSFANAKAISEYIKANNYDRVSLVCMGNNTKWEAKEDTLCAKYIEALLTYRDFNLNDLKAIMRNQGGERFFNKDTQDSQPKEDFDLCLEPDQFNFVIQALKVDNDLYEMKRIDI